MTDAVPLSLRDALERCHHLVHAPPPETVTEEMDRRAELRAILKGSGNSSVVWDYLVESAPEVLRPRLNKYIPWNPNPGPQTAFLLYEGREAFYGGAAGGGKSVALLMAALQWVDVPGYSALLLRRTYKQLVKPGALIPLSHEWLADTDATWNGDRKQWTFPSGAVLEFGFLDHPNDRYNYQGAAYDFVGFDELTQFRSEEDYLYLFSRLRRSKDSVVPSRMRATGNPGGVGHEWVKSRFVDHPEPPARVYFPATLEDNPQLDREDYEQGLELLPEVERRRLRHGDWEIVPDGPLWSADHFPAYDTDPRNLVEQHKRRGFVFTVWDCKGKLHTSRKVRAGESFVSGTCWLAAEGRLYLLDEEHGPYGLDDTLSAVRRLAARWPMVTAHAIEDKAMGPEVMAHLRSGRSLQGARSTPLPGVVSHTPERAKEVRYEGIQPNVVAGDILVPNRYAHPWVSAWLSEIAHAPTPPNDRTDTLVMAVERGLHRQVKAGEVKVRQGRKIQRPSW